MREAINQTHWSLNMPPNHEQTTRNVKRKLRKGEGGLGSGRLIVKEDVTKLPRSHRYDLMWLQLTLHLATRPTRCNFSPVDPGRKSVWEEYNTAFGRRWNAMVHWRQNYSAFLSLKIFIVYRAFAKEWFFFYIFYFIIYRVAIKKKCWWKFPYTKITLESLVWICNSNTMLTTDREKKGRRKREDE